MSPARKFPAPIPPPPPPPQKKKKRPSSPIFFPTFSPPLSLHPHPNIPIGISILSFLMPYRDITCLFVLPSELAHIFSYKMWQHPCLVQWNLNGITLYTFSNLWKLNLTRIKLSWILHLK